MLLCCSDPASADLDQFELPVLCDGLRRYLQDLPQPIVPTAICAQMVLTAKGENKITSVWIQLSHFFSVQMSWNRITDVMSLCSALEHSVLWTENHKTSSVPFSPDIKLFILILFMHSHASATDDFIDAYICMLTILCHFLFSLSVLLPLLQAQTLFSQHALVQGCTFLPSHGQKQDICG